MKNKLEADVKFFKVFWGVQQMSWQLLVFLNSGKKRMDEFEGSCENAELGTFYTKIA